LTCFVIGRMIWIWW